MMSLKEDAIREYLSKINFKTDNWSYQKLEEDMSRFLGERPALDIQYKNDVQLNEVSGESKKITSLDKIYVVFMDTDDKYKKIEIFF